jgi:hypothetical protein
VPRLTSPENWCSSSRRCWRRSDAARDPAREPGADLLLARLCWVCAGSAIAPAADALARDHGISRATAYRYLDEVVLVLADQAPELVILVSKRLDVVLRSRDTIRESPRLPRRRIAAG